MNEELEKLDAISIMESAGYDSEFIQMLLDSYYDPKKYEFKSTQDLLSWIDQDQEE